MQIACNDIIAQKLTDEIERKEQELRNLYYDLQEITKENDTYESDPYENDPYENDSYENDPYENDPYENSINDPDENEQDTHYLKPVLDEYKKHYGSIISEKKSQLSAFRILLDYLDNLTFNLSLSNEELNDLKNNKKIILKKIKLIENELKMY